MVALQYDSEVKKALAQDKPVVALESTIISHGMPYPDNVKTALEVEEIVRNSGAVPSTIGIVDGEIKVGLSEREIQILAESDEVVKVSRRDMPIVMARGLHGATTVAGTTVVAEMAGIEVFVTGGVGGVHRDASETFDISADLRQLANSNVAVVSAGVKSILDIGATLERLETYGVPVLGYDTEVFPAFYSRESDHSVDYRVNSPEEVAELIHSRLELGLEGGMIIANPVPEGDEIEFSKMNQVIEETLEEARGKDINGKELTPFLLDRIVEKTDGKSLETNKSLVKNNARLGGRIAAKLADKF